MYTAEEIKWIKNVFHNNGSGWAYDNTSFSTENRLNWSTETPGSAKVPLPGELIVLFQKPSIINGRSNKIVHFTHIVTPKNLQVKEDLRYPDHKWYREVEVIAFAYPIDSIPNPGYFNFHKPNRGGNNPIKNLTNSIGMDEDDTKTNLWWLFRNFMNPNLITAPTSNYPPVVFEYEEGEKIVKEHIKIEVALRNGKLAQDAKNVAFLSGNGRILCECCKFDFVKMFGVHGNKFIECHHRVFISKGKRKTKPEDLALVCANCHRMLHRKKDPKIKNDMNNYYSVEELRDLIIDNIIA